MDEVLLSYLDSFDMDALGEWKDFASLRDMFQPIPDDNPIEFEFLAGDVYEFIEHLDSDKRLQVHDFIRPLRFRKVRTDCIHQHI